MSSFMLKNDSICMISDFIGYVLNEDSFHRGYNVSSELKRELIKSLFSWNKPVGRYEESVIHEELSMMNCQALFEIYGVNDKNGNYEAYKETHFSFIPIWEQDGRYRVTQKHFQLLKTLDCYLYQCNEGDIPTYDIYKALDKLRVELMRFIVQNDILYVESKWQ